MAQDNGKNDFAAIERRLEALERQNAALAKRNNELETALAASEPLPEDERPVYEIVNEAYYSPDDIYYPVGAQFTDVTGTIIPSEAMVPLNEPAKARMRDWLESLPASRKTPPIELIIQAATELRPRDGEATPNLADFNKAVLERALSLALDGSKATPSAGRQVTMPAKPGNVPLMSNTRINNRQIITKGPRFTELRQEAVAPADKREPVVSTKADMLGRFAHPGVST